MQTQKTQEGLRKICSKLPACSLADLLVQTVIHTHPQDFLLKAINESPREDSVPRVDFPPASNPSDLEFGSVNSEGSDVQDLDYAPGDKDSDQSFSDVSEPETTDV